MKRIQDSRQPSAVRRGFTLVEIMVVIVVVGILMALLLPALSAANRKAKEAKVLAEIQQLGMAIQTFKSKYGAEPPSRFIFCESGADWSVGSSDTDYSTIQESKAIIRRLWPQFPFDSTNYNVNGNGSSTERLKMNAGECLMFFLGGVMSNGTPTGFSKNPAAPFGTSGGSREGPFLEFDSARIKDSNSNSIMEYFDSLPSQKNPYLYFSSYEGTGYKSIEYSSLMTDIYRDSTSASPSGTMPGTSTQSLTAYKAKSFQIISPGYDGEYGQGGIFNPKASPSVYDSKDYDNLTNFHGSRLSP